MAEGGLSQAFSFSAQPGGFVHLQGPPGNGND